MVTEVTVLARGAGALTAVPKEPRQALLVTLGAVPAGLTGDAPPLRHLAGLLALTVTAPVGGAQTARRSHLQNPPTTTHFAREIQYEQNLTHGVLKRA